MGNLWSSDGEQVLRRRNEEVRKQQLLEAELRRQQNVEFLQRLERQRQLQIRQSIILTARQADVYPRSEIVSQTETTSENNLVMVNYITDHSTTSSWEPMTSFETVKYVDLSCTSPEYIKLAEMFRRTNKKFFKVTHIERVQNPYLYGAYLLKREELTSRLGYPEEKLLFHGTKRSNIDKICQDNLDWRMHGKGTGHRFGRGVSFSPISNYATHYCDKKTNVKVMLVVKVLITRSCDGSSEMSLPPVGFDTTHKEGGHVIVKYCDNEYYPAYKLYFTQVNLYQ